MSDPKAYNNIIGSARTERGTPAFSETQSVKNFDSGLNNSKQNLQERPKPKNRPILSRIVNILWATRQTRDTKQDPDLLVKTTLKELILYGIFLVLICIITFGMTNSINYYFTNALMTLFLKQTTTVGAGMNFVGMGTMNDYWNVLREPLINGIYWDTWYNGENTTDNNFIYYENKLLGVPRLRQFRVKRNSCKVHKFLSDYIDSCYAAYSSSTEEKEPIGPYYNQSNHNMNENNTQYFYQSASGLGSHSVSGLLADYTGGGYVKELSTSKSESVNYLDQLFNNTWTDRGTRAVSLDFTIYNANINLFCQIRLLAEFPQFGGVKQSWVFRSVKLIRYVTSMDYFIFACEIMFSLFIVYYTIEEILEIRIHGLKYFKALWNILDIVVIVTAYICMGFNAYRHFSVKNKLDDLLMDTNQFPEFETISFWQMQFNYVVAMITFICWIKIFKYVSFNKTMTQLSSTLSRCVKDILGFAVMFLIVFFAYAQLGYLLFGTKVKDYSTFANTFFTLLRIILGDFDFQTLEQASPFFGPLYFITYVFFVFFVLLNMFLAIINDTYSEVKSDPDAQKSEIELSTYFKKSYQKLKDKVTKKKDKMIDITKALEMADVNKDGEMTFEEWRDELLTRGYSNSEIESYFTKYDKNNDRCLNKEEMDEMRAKLQKEIEGCDAEMNKIKNKEQNIDLEQQEEKEIEDFHRQLDTLTAEEMAIEDDFIKQNRVTPSEFRIITQRVDVMEHSMGNIVNKIDAVLTNLENVEKAKIKRREAMAKILEKLNDVNSIADDEKRATLQKMVKNELDSWEAKNNSATSPTSMDRVPSASYSSRAASPPNSSLDIKKKSAYRQQ